MTVPEPLEPQVAQLRAERANAVVYGQTDIVAAVDRQLAALGVKDEEKPAEPESEPAARKQAPQGRSTRAKSTTAKPDEG